MAFYDSHCHLNDERLLPVLDEVVLGAEKQNVKTLLCVGYDIESSKKAIEIANRYNGVYAAVGFHPENLEGLKESDLLLLEEMAKNPKVIAIGEIGLDYHWYPDPKDRLAQDPWFIAQIELANKLNLPVSIHARDASAHTYEILKEHPLKAGGVLHCYSGSVEMLKEFAKLGFYFGFDGPITYKNALTPKECVKACPRDRILSETDSPYLTPTLHRGEMNKPEHIPHIVAAMAELRGTSLEEMEKTLSDNFERLFRVKP